MHIIHDISHNTFFEKMQIIIMHFKNEISRRWKGQLNFLSISKEMKKSPILLNAPTRALCKQLLLMKEPTTIALNPLND
jgi:hypothetical protein